MFTSRLVAGRRQRTSVYRAREGSGSLNIPLSCPSPGRECTTFFSGAFVKALFRFFRLRREATRPPPRRRHLNCKGLASSSMAGIEWADITDMDKSAGQMEMLKVKATIFMAEHTNVELMIPILIANWCLIGKRRKILKTVAGNLLINYILIHI